MRLSDSGDLALLHGFFQLFERFLRDQLSGTALIHPADQKLAQTALLIGSEPPLALTAAVSSRALAASPRFERSSDFRSLRASSLGGTGGCSDGVSAASLTVEGLLRLPARSLFSAWLHCATNEMDRYDNRRVSYIDQLSLLHAL